MVMTEIFNKLKSLQVILGRKYELENKINEAPKQLDSQGVLLDRMRKEFIEKNHIYENIKEKVKTKDIAVMTLDLTEGLMDLGENGQSFKDKYAGKSYFPYVTPYSQTNTGFTPAPEQNDRVALYFPSENETHALVMGAVNNNGNGRFTNPDKRNFTLGPSQAARGGTPANEGKPMYNFTLDSEKFIVSVGSIISLSSSGTVGITGTSNVDIASTGSSATLSAGQNIDITADQNATVTASSGIATLSGNTDATVPDADPVAVSAG